MKTTKLILTLITATILTSCVKTIEVVREVPVEVTKYVQRSDTLLINTTDSVYIRERGDTVLIERFRTMYRDRIRIQTDSVPYIVEITKTETKTVEVDKPVKVRNTIYWLGWLLILYAGYRAYRFAMRFIKPI